MRWRFCIEVQQAPSFNRAELKLENGAPEVFQGNEWREFDSDVLKPAIVTILCLK